MREKKRCIKPLRLVLKSCDTEIGNQELQLREENEEEEFQVPVTYLAEDIQ